MCIGIIIVMLWICVGSIFFISILNDLSEQALETLLIWKFVLIILLCGPLIWINIGSMFFGILCVIIWKKVIKFFS